ncbi:hypothetical protein N7530_010385 [Penicillium desertorum]|uniref:Uncharacterized protein n=1 Tax=Penicillium desertorum TaxID=1303715 RepID=A0A9W9WHD5_9EURO|nr:hypothetical protein N7530_010385 [Penicillium desertorum]
MSTPFLRGRIVRRGYVLPLSHAPQMPIECLASHRHLNLVEWILHHIVRIELVDLLYDCVHAASQGIRKQQELRPGESLKASHSKLVGLEVIQAGDWYTGVWVGVAGRSRGGDAC